MNRLTIFLFLLSVFVLGFLPVKDTDFGWHYRCGNQFLTSGKLCLTNEFSYFLPDYKAYYSGHLYDIFLAFIYNHGGFVAISIIGGLIFAFSALLFLRLTQTDLPIKIIGFFIIFFLSFHVFSLGLRPQIFSYLFFIFLLFLLKDKKSQMLLTIPLFFLFWANIHIGFFIGLIVLAFYVVGNGFKPFLTIIFLLSFFATLINPFGIFVYKEIFNHALSPLSSMIAEWVRPDMLQIVFIMVLGGMAVIKILKTKSFSLYYFFLVLFFGLLALQARRNLPFFYTVFFYVVFHDFKLNLRSLTDPVIPLLIAIIVFVGIIQTPKTIQFDASWENYCKKDSENPYYPCQALKKYPQIHGNVYSLYEWGGFLIWQKPEIKVFVDGRMPAWKDEEGKSPYQVYLDIIQTQPGWNEKLNQWKTDYIFISNGTFLDLLLQKEAEKYHWKQVYRDNSTTIYQKHYIIYI